MLCRVFISQLFLYKVSTWVWCPVLSFSCCNLSVSLCFSWFRKEFPERKKTLLFCRVMFLAYLSLCPRCIARQLLIRWSVSRRQIHHLEQKPGAVWTSARNLRPRGVIFIPAKVVLIISEFLVLRCFRQYFGLSFSVLSQAESNVTFIMSVCPSACVTASPTGRVFREILNFGLCWLKAYGNNEDLRSCMISRHDWSS
jgi:hypothetical protein